MSRPKSWRATGPEYPQPEADNREKGFVSIICTIGVDGKATEFEIEQMTDPAFAYEAVRAIAKWKWAPAMKNGHPVTAQGPRADALQRVLGRKRLATSRAEVVSVSTSVSETVQHRRDNTTSVEHNAR